MRRRRWSLYAMAALYIAAGINHFLNPDTYQRIMPRWLPAHAALVAASGVAEIVLGILLLPRATRKFAARGIIALLVAVFPANVQMALDWQASGHPYTWIAWARLPLQGLLIWWAWRWARKPSVPSNLPPGKTNLPAPRAHRESRANPDA